MYLTNLAAALTLAGVACAAPLKNLKRQEIQDTYDFIIAGGMQTSLS